jgi:hypothetical protein
MTNLTSVNLNSTKLVANLNGIGGKARTAKSSKTVTVENIAQGHHARIVPGKSITLYGFETNSFTPHSYETSFEIGDSAEYNSYNLSYVGIITSITAKTVTIVAYHGTSSATTYRLSLERFEWRNREFDAEKTAKRNSEWMD